MNTKSDFKNSILVHYEELGGIDIEVSVTSEEMADFILKREYNHGFDSLKFSSDFAERVIASSFKTCLDDFEKRFRISDVVGWGELVRDSEDFYEFEKEKHRKDAMSIYKRKKGIAHEYQQILKSDR